MGNILQKLILGILSSIFLLIFLSNTAFSYVYCETGKILTKVGYLPIEIYENTNEFSCIFEIVFKGENLDNLKIDNIIKNNISSDNGERIIVAPNGIFLNSGFGKYGFWTIKGTYNKIPFILFGLVTEGKLIESKLLPHSLIFFTISIIVIISIVVIKRKKDKK